MKYSKFKMIVMVGIIANQSFLTNTAQLSGNPTPSRSADSLLVLTTKYEVQKIIDNPELFSISEGKLTIEKQDVPLDLLQHIAKYYYLLSGNKLEEKFSSCKRHVVSKGKPIYGFSIQELIDNNRLPAIEIDFGRLDLNDKKINDLHGIENIPNLPQLRKLVLGHNKLTDISALANVNLSQLRGLYLDNNKLTDISPLAGADLSQLTGLGLDNNKLTDISPLAGADLSQLTYLGLFNNQLTNISALAGADLSQLTRLDLFANQLTDISALANANMPQLTLLNLCANQLTDISALASANMPQLTRLDLFANQLTDISALANANMPQLERLSLFDNQLTDISPLASANMPQLKDLNLNNNPIDVTTVPQYNISLPSAFRTAILLYTDRQGNTLLDKAVALGDKGSIDNLELYSLLSIRKKKKI